MIATRERRQRERRQRERRQRRIARRIRTLDLWIRFLDTLGGSRA